MKRKDYQPLPALLDFSEGRAQDKKADLIAAFRRVANEQRRKHPTDLHVRELLTFVLARSVGDEGVKISYRDIADHLECEYRTAKTVVERAVKSFKLLEAIEQRYASSAQTANAYRILWPVVRYTLASKQNYEGGATEWQPPATERHGGATEWQPTTLTSSLTSFKKETTTTKAAQTSPAPGTAWEVVVVALEEAGVGLKDEAIAGAVQLGFDAEHCMALVRLFWELPEGKRSPGVLYRWFTMRRSAPRLDSRRELPARRTSMFDRERVRQEALMFHRKKLKAESGGTLTDEQLLEIDRLAELAANAAEERFAAQQKSAAAGSSRIFPSASQVV